jgi:hypothetical protein
MAQPNVSIEFVNSGLGAVNIGADNICGLIATGVAVSGKLTLGVPVSLSSLDDATTYGIDADYDAANTCKVFKHLSDFYSQAPRGTQLWLVVYPKTVLLSDMALGENEIISDLLQASAGKISFIGLSRTPDDGYEQTNTVTISGDTVNVAFDSDAFNAIQLAQATAEAERANYRYFRVIIEGRGASDGSGSAFDLTTLSSPNVAVINTNSDGGSWAAVGLALGRAAALPVQRKIAYRLDGALNGVNDQYLSSGTKDYMRPTELAGWHDKGYLQVIPVQGLVGLYFNNDLTCTNSTDDQQFLARGRVIDKAAKLAVATYNRYVNSEVEVDASGNLTSEYVAMFRGLIERELRQQMVANKQLSGAVCYINPVQNVLSTSSLEIELQLQPVGYASYIVVKIKYTATL